MADGSITFDIEILDKRAKAKMKELETTVQEAGETIDESLNLSASKFIADWNKAESDYQKIASKIELNAKKLNDAMDIQIKAEGEHGIGSKENQNALVEVQRLSDIQDGLIAREQQLIVNRSILASKTVAVTESLREQTILEDETNRKLTLKQKLLGGIGLIATKTAGYIRSQTNELDKSTKSAKRLESASKGVGKSIGGSLKSLLRVSLAMLGIRGVMTGVNKITREWYNSNNAGAKQAQANMSALSSGLVNALAPALTWITNLMATLFGYINAIAVAFFGVNLLSKSTSKNLGTGAGNAKKLGKEIKGFTASFDEADVASSNLADNLDGAGGGGGGLDLEHNIKTPDFSKFRDELLKAFKPFLDTIKSIDLKPLEKAFEQLANSVKNILGIIANSFVNVMNNSIGPFIKLMAEEIAPRFLILLSEWLDMLAPHLEYFLTNLVEPFINWFLLDLSPVFFETLASGFELLTVIVDAFLKALTNVWEEIEPFVTWLGTVFKEALEGLGIAFQDLTKDIKDDDSQLVEFFEVVIKVLGVLALFKIAVMIGTTVASLFGTGIKLLMVILKPLITVLKVIAGIFSGAFAGSIAAVIAVVALLGTMFLGLITNFEQVKEDFMRIVGNIKGIFNGLLDFIGGVFTGDWSRIWSGLVQIFSNIIGGIVNIFKFPINLMIDGLNFFIRGLNKIKIPSWVPGVGGKGINIGQIPRLAKGGVLTTQTTATMAEYPNARTNPEIVTPQKIMRETLADALADSGANMNGNQEMTIVVQTVLDGRVVAESTNKVNKEDKFQLNGGNLAWNM